MYPKVCGLGLQSDAEFAAAGHVANRSIKCDAPVFSGDQSMLRSQLALAKGPGAH